MKIEKCQKRKIEEPPKYEKLTLEQKIEILHRLDSGESGAKVARDFNVNRSTVTRIKHKKHDILNYIKNLEERHVDLDKKVMNHIEDNSRDSALFEWMLQRQCLGQPITGTILQAKALVFNELLDGSSDFTASNGWLCAFQKRYAIRKISLQVSIYKQHPHPRYEASDEFCREFLQWCIKDGIDIENVFNADESGLLWKLLTQSTFALKHLPTPEGQNLPKNRLTVMFCSNVTGSLKIPLLVIGKLKHSRCFASTKNLPIPYRSQKNAWMDGHVFEDWLKNIFVPSVKTWQAENQKSGKVILLLDNAGPHKLRDFDWNSLDIDVEPKFLPPNVTSLIQPMDQGIIEKMKRMYRKAFLSRLYSEQDNSLFKDRLKSWNMKDTLFALSEAWDSVTPSNLRNAWKKIFPLCTCEIETHENDYSDLVALVRQIPELQDYAEIIAERWILEEQSEVGHEIFTDEQIVSFFQRNLSPFNKTNEEEERSETISEEQEPSAEDFSAAIDVACKYLKKKRKLAPELLAKVEKLVSMFPSNFL